MDLIHGKVTLGPKLIFVTGLEIFVTAVARLVCPDLHGKCLSRSANIYCGPSCHFTNYIFHLPYILGFELLQLLLIVGLYLELIFLHLLLKLEIILICLIKSPTQLLLFSKVISIIDVVGILAFS